LSPPEYQQKYRSRQAGNRNPRTVGLQARGILQSAGWRACAAQAIIVALCEEQRATVGRRRPTTRRAVIRRRAVLLSRNKANLQNGVEQLPKRDKARAGQNHWAIQHWVACRAWCCVHAGAGGWPVRC
ncbi:hypothetical protein T310_8891, partial [Rasamsonia emersonii CBS 393.64]